MNFIVKKFNELTTLELYEILKSRAQIFIVEQNINYQDMDDIDYQSLHCFFEEDGRVVAYLRAFYTEPSVVKIGRVLTLEHGNGLGKKLMEQSLPEIKSLMNPSKIYMHAQKHAAGFYEKLGFQTTSSEFIEEGVVHVEMELL